MRAANLGLKFLLELAALAALAYWGASVHIVPAFAAPLAMIALWVWLAAPRTGSRSPGGRLTANSIDKR